MDRNGFLLASPPFNYSEGTIGLFGLVGAAGAIMAPKGILSIKARKAHYNYWVGVITIILDTHRFSNIPWSHLSLYLVLDLAVQAVHVTSQSTLYRILPEARNRLTARLYDQHWGRTRISTFRLCL